MERERFGPYRLDGLLGRGGLGESHRPHDTVRDRAVALKLLPAALVHDSGFQARFRREARVAARLREPHVVPIHDWGEIDGRLFLDMRLVEGEDLGALLARHGALPAARAVEIVSQVAGALDAAHADGLVHRDVKPSNVLLTTHDDRDFAYLCDFGIASARGEATVLTASGVTLGTLAYMAPEQFLGAGVDHRADVYSLACLLHEALTGARPFAATSAPALMHAHLYLPPAPPSHVRAGLPAGLDAVVGRGMAKEPTDRHPSAGALAAAARAALHPGGAPVAPPTAPRLPLPAAAPTWTPPPAAPPVPRRNRVPWLVVGAAAAAVFTLVAAVALVGGPGDRPSPNTTASCSAV